MKPSTALVAALALAFGLAAPASGQGYPTRPITVVVPFVAGGPTDTVARLVADSMSRHLGQQIAIQNVGGAGGTLGARQVATAPNDGYILLLHHIGMATAPSLYRSLPYDPLTDFLPIGEITAVPMTLVARADFAPDTLEDLIAYIRRHGEDVTYANAGVGSASQLCGMLLMDALDTPMTVVEYLGTGPAISDIVRGRIDILCDQTTNTMPQILGGQVKAYAVTTAARLATLPALPSVLESGATNFTVSIWHGLYAPAGTPESVIAALSEALQVALADETVVARFAELGTAPVSIAEATPASLSEKLASQIELWRTVIEDAGVYAD